MIDFKSVKSLVTAREAAEHYGLTVNRHGMAVPSSLFFIINRKKE